MPQRYVEAILKYLSGREYQPLKPRQVARQLGVADDDYGTFREAVKILRDSGRIVLGAKDALTLPEMASRVVGFFRPNPRGFGFIVPETPNAHGDLFIPPEGVGGAMNGDLVVARVMSRGKRQGKAMFAGQIVEILQRGQNRFVGTLDCTGGTWFVLPDGKQMSTPIVVRDTEGAGPQAGSKVVVEIVQYPGPGEFPAGVIVEQLGGKGRLEVETLAVVRAHGLEERFPDAALADARASIQDFDGSPDGRTDLTRQVIITIDPADARDFDDAIGLEIHNDGRCTLGVHIADVSHFVREGTSLDEEARRRGTSVYFPRKVLPMLPEVLSNGVCSLQEAQSRYCKSAFVTYDAQAKVVGSRFAETVIRSAKRLTYEQAQQIIDGKVGGYDRRVVELLRNMEKLARLIEQRRRKAGMLHLDLPEVKLVFDEGGRVIDAVKEDDSYTHTMIEMFMVEANEAVASLMDRLDRPCLRRIHPAPEQSGSKDLSAFIRACGHKLPRDLTRRDIMSLLESVKGRPESYAVNLAVLKTFQQAEYSPMTIGHFALASDHYCHFTSPIRRYPDLTIHRLLSDYCRGRMDSRPPEDTPELRKLAEHCNAAERRAQAAEEELREVLILQFLETKVGESFDGVITGVANFGIFVQSPRFLVEGLVRLEDLGDDWWDVQAQYGQVTGEHSGKRYRIGDLLSVRIAGVDVARRRLNLVPEPRDKDAKRQAKPRDEAHRPRGRKKTRR